MATVAFWAAAVLLAQTYFLYPLWLLLLSRLRPASPGVPSRTQPLPAVSLVVAAHDEAGCIEEKLRNSLQLDYPPDRLEVLIGSDGSTDGTDDLVRAYPDPRVHLSAAARAGKTTRSQPLHPRGPGRHRGALRRQHPHRAGSAEGAGPPLRGPRGGRGLRAAPALQPHAGRVRGERLLEVRVLAEGARGDAGSGGRGQRRALRHPPGALHPPAALDHRGRLRHSSPDARSAGTASLYEPEALASEETTEDYGREFGRRARIAAGNFQSLGLVPGLLSPLRGFPAFAFWSHKVLRWCAPALMLVALVANAALLDQRRSTASPWPRRCGFYALAMLGSVAVGPSLVRRVAGVAYYFVTMNLAIAVGFWRFLRNSQAAAWERTARA